MNQSDDDNILNELYQQSHDEQPPKTLDNLILRQAKLSNRASKPTKSWRPWLAAASVALVMPMIWLLIQNNQLLEQTSSLSPLESPKPQSAKPAKELRKQTNQAAAEPVLEEEAQNAPVESIEPAVTAADIAIESDDSHEYLQEDFQDKKVVVTGSRIKRESLETDSVKANRELLMNEFKVKKKTLKQSNLDPILALELQRFDQYLEQEKIEQATQLLQEMMEREPDFDYSELEQRLADAREN
ncbi:MAG: hypothetical protein KDI92_11830 [Xanthomonadales bacterium]|nr:hypothetical protein [Xanthomonadales bacterium]